MADNQHIFQHFNADERVFVEHVLDKIDRVANQYSYELTDFLNPREAFITESLAKREGLQVFSSADICPTENRRLILAPDYYELAIEDFDLSLLALDYARKFNKLSHGQILGNLLNQVGIKRQLIGDILLTEDTCQILVDQKISSHLMQTVTKISRVPVKWRELDLTDLILINEEGKMQEVLATSWRLDHLLALGYRLSRPVSIKLIETGRVKVNHQVIDKPSHLVAETDLISCRGYGRLEICAYNGQTKNGKLKLSLKKIGGK